MQKVFIIADEDKRLQGLLQELTREGYACSVVPDGEEVIERIAAEAPDLVLVESSSHARISELSRRIKEERNLPVIALVKDQALASINGHLDLVDDFILHPYDLRELNLRVERLLHRSAQVPAGEILRCGDLTMDMAKYEVFVAGRPILLTFKEYELLKFLVSNSGRVFTRETLLNKVWGYDYYGGDRTVDVHIKRLRSKIENSSRISIETVRNIGYRLRAEG